MRNAKRSFEREIISAQNLTDVLAGLVILLYSFFILNLSFTAYFTTIIGVVIGILIAQFVCSPITGRFLAGSTSKMLAEWNKGGFDEKRRTELFLKLHRIPKLKQVESFLYFFFGAIALFSYFHFGMRANIYVNLASLFACWYGAYVTSILTAFNMQKLVSKYCRALVDEGIDESVLNEKKYFGVSYRKTFISYCLIPVIWEILLFCVILCVYYYNNRVTPIGFFPAEVGGYGVIREQLSRIAIVVLMSAVVACASIYSFLNSILLFSGKLQDAMVHIIKNDVFTVDLTATDFENEVSYNIYLVNKVVVLFRSILNEIRKIGNTMAEPIGELSATSQNTAAAALEQSTGVKEILATMEDTDAQTRGIVEKISDVATVAEGTEKNVGLGFATLQLNLDKMNEITEANLTTISEIRELGEKIGGIWEIVKIINDVADQTRIIAFNAELEASGAGESGRNFHIVANEVRRLAAGITDSVNQIKDRITNIQHTSDNLIITSESGTEKIREGLELSEKLKEKFSDIQSSSEITAESASQIKEIIYQQSTAFDQIVSTVRQISSGIENFSTSTNAVNETAQKLKDAANYLENLHKTVAVEN